MPKICPENLSELATKKTIRWDDGEASRLTSQMIWIAADTQTPVEVLQTAVLTALRVEGILVVQLRYAGNMEGMFINRMPNHPVDVEDPTIEYVVKGGGGFIQASLSKAIEVNHTLYA
jgi:hypothetical protein